MAKRNPKDNSTGRQKAWLRREVRKAVGGTPVVMETHAGLGWLWERVYADCPVGVAVEKDLGRIDYLARQRPTWAIYGADVVAALTAGLGSHFTIKILDLDPYGDPWPTIAAFFGSERPFEESMELVVNDGMRNACKHGVSWHCASLRAVVQRHKNELYAKYIEVCRELLTAAIEPAGYAVQSFRGYYTGKNSDMTHYWARLARG